MFSFLCQYRDIILSKNFLLPESLCFCFLQIFQSQNKNTDKNALSEENYYESGRIEIQSILSYGVSSFVLSLSNEL